MTDGPVLGVSAVVVSDGCLLMVKRGPGVLAGLWSLPGGKVGLAERLEDALAREVLEETGLFVVVGDRVAIHEELPGRRVPGHYVIVAFRATVEGGTLAAGDDAAEAEWVPLPDVRRRLTTPGLLAVLRDAGLRTS